MFNLQGVLNPLHNLFYVMSRYSGKNKNPQPVPSPFPDAGRRWDYDESVPVSSGRGSNPSAVNADPLNGSNINLGGLLDSDSSYGQQVGFGLQALSQSGQLGSSLAALIGDRKYSSEEWALFLQAVIQYMSTIDQRNYDQQMTQDQRDYSRWLQLDQRIYDSPTNILARLMGAGVSRDAAIQMLSGGASSGSANPAAPNVVSGPAAGVGSMPATPGTAAQGWASLGINALQALFGMVHSGVDLAVAIPQVQMMKAQSYMSQSDMNAYQDATQVTQLIQNLQDQGVLSQKDFDSWNNLSDFQSWLNDHRDTNAVAPYYQNGSINGAFGTKFGREHLSSFWSNVIKGRTDGSLTDEFLKNQRLQNIISSLQPDKIAAEMALIGTQVAQGVQEISESEQRIIESCNRIAVGDAQIQVLDAQGKWYNVQSRSTERLTDSQVDLMVSQRYGQDIENNEASLRYDYNSAGFPMLKQSRLYELQDELDKWALMRSPDVRKQRISTWLQDADNAYDAAYLKHISLEASGDFAKYYPALFMLSQGFKDAGVNDLVRSGSSAAGAAAALRKVKML